MQTIELHKTIQSEKYNKRNKKKEMKKEVKKLVKKNKHLKETRKWKSGPLMQWK